MRLDTSRRDGTTRGTALHRLCSRTWLAPARAQPGPEAFVPVLRDGGAAEGGCGGLSSAWQGAFWLALCQDGHGGGMAGPLGGLRARRWGGCVGGERGSGAGPRLKQSSGRGVPAGGTARGQQHLGVHGASRSRTGCFWCKRCGRGRGAAVGGRAPCSGPHGQGWLRAVTAAWTSVAAAGVTSAPCFHPLSAMATPSPRWQHRSAPGRPRTRWG